MVLIQISLSLDIKYMIFNFLTNYYSNKYSSSNFYLFLLSIFINWLICFFISYSIEKTLIPEMIVKTNKVEKTDNGFYVQMSINKKK